MFKRIISLVVCLAALPFTNAVMAENVEKEETVENKQFNMRIEKLEALGVSIEDEKEPQTIIKRAEFINSFLDFMNVIPNSEECGFYDVDSDYIYSDAINTGANLGIMVGYSDGYYYPENNITTNEAIKVIVNALGFDIMATQKGGYPTGYIAVASSIGLLDNIKLKDDELSYDNFTKLLENALECEVFDMNFEDGRPVYKQTEDVDALWKFFNVIEVKGIVTANSVTSIDDANGKTIDKTTVKIDNETVEVADTNAADYLGYSVKAYIYYADKDETGVIKYILPGDRNTVVKVNDENIYGDTNSFSAYNFVYEDENGKVRNVKIGEETSVIYNGVAKPEYTKDDLIPEIGNVTLIDNDGDGKYEIIDIFKAEKVIITDSVSTTDDGIKIYDEKDPDLTYLYDDEYEDYEIYVNGKESVVTSISKDMVVLIGTNGEHSITYAFGNIISGEITSMGQDNEGKGTVKIDGKEYRMAQTCVSYNFKVGEKGKFMVDDSNRVYTFEKDITGQMLYGYLIKGFYDETESPVYAAIRVLTAENRYKKYEIGDYLILNGKKYEKEEVMKFFKIDHNDKNTWQPQLIMYELTEDEIVKKVCIEDDAEDAQLKHAGTFYHGKKETLPPEYQGLVTKEKALGNMWLDKKKNIYWGATNGYAHYYMSWGGIWYNDPNTIFFVINDTDPEKSYIEPSWNAELHDYPYVHKMYNEDENTGTIGAVVWKKEGGTSTLPEINKMVRATIVKNVSTGLNKDDEVIKTLECVQGGKDIVINWNDDAPDAVKECFNKLQPGDIVFYTLDGLGELDNLYRSFNIERIGEYGEVGQNPIEVHDGHDVNIHYEKRTVYSKFKKKYPNNFFTYEANEDDNIGRKQKMWSTDHIYKMTVKNNKVRVETITYDDVQSGDEVYYIITGRRINDMIVIDKK